MGLILAFVTSVMAFILCDKATDVCGFLIGYIPVADEDDGVEQLQRRKIGINVYEDYNGDCVSWRKGQDMDIVFADSDIIWKFVRWFADIATIVTILLIILLAMASCISYPQRWFMVTAWIFQGTTVLYIMSFLAYGSDVCHEQDCWLDVGTSMMIAGVLVWPLAATFTFFLGYPRLPTAAESEPRANNNSTHVDDNQVQASNQTGSSRKRSLYRFVAVFVVLIVGGGVIVAAVIASVPSSLSSS
jgi:hypothetical protein